MKIDVGDMVVMRDEAFQHFDEDCSELRGIEAEVVYISSNGDGSSKDLTLKFECPNKILITKLPRSYVQIAGRA